MANAALIGKYAIQTASDFDTKACETKPRRRARKWRSNIERDTTAQATSVYYGEHQMSENLFDIITGKAGAEMEQTSKLIV